MGKRLCFLILALWAAGCSGGGDGAADPSAVRIHLSSEPVTLDFSAAEDGLSMRVLGALMSGLTRYDGENRLINGIAESIERKNGGRGFRVRLREWKWSDGVPVRAADFVYGIRRTLEPGAVTKLADLLFFIKDALPYKQGKLKDFSKVGVRAPDDRTLEFELESAFGFFPHILSLSMTFPQREDLVAKWGARWPEHMAATGPYRIARWERDQALWLERNPHYPDFAADMPSRIEFRVVHDENTAANLLESGKLDLAFRIPALELERFRKTGRVKEFPFFATYYLGFDQRKAPWNLRAARAAVAHAIDRGSLVRALGGGDRAATSWIPPEVPGANAAAGLKHDVARARAEWKKVPSSKEKSAAYSKAFVLGFDAAAKNQTAAEKIRADVKDALGIELALRNRDWKTYVRELSADTPPIYRFGLMSLFVDAFAHLFLFESGNPNNYTGWSSGEYDRLLHAIAAIDPAGAGAQPRRQKLIDRAQKMLLVDDVVIVPIFHYVQTVAFSKRMKDFRVNGMGLIDFASLRLAK
ncbi:MAG: peptide ABC transporter substrate-binding protein [Deltaproteobacteria bacterium]|nr:peptide ABC transporter substrate-binding protein [Deltaproteobacteria bacterium]